MNGPWIFHFYHWEHLSRLTRSSTIRLWPSTLTKMTVWLDSKQSTFGSTVHYPSRTTVYYKTDKGSLFLLILMWWAFISFCNSRCPWSRSQGGLSSNNRIAPSELKEHSDSPPDYDTVLGICSNSIIDPKQPKPYPKLIRSPRKFSWEPNDSGWISLMIPRYEKQMWIPAQFNQNYPILAIIELGSTKVLHI